MGSKGKPPPAPDYVGAAQAQGAANVDAARTSAKLSNPNIINPYGTQTVTYNGDQATVNQQLSDVGQKLFDQQNRISQGMGDLAEGGISRVGNMLGTGFDTSKLPTMTGRVGVQPTEAGTDGITTQIADPRRAVQYDIAGQQNAIKGSIDPRFDQSGQQVEDALYRRQTSRLDPQFQQSEADMTARLANQGIMQGSEAYKREMDNFARAKNDAYSGARDSAILAAGQEQSRLNDMGLSRANLANTANAQEFGQAATRAGFSNAANAQEFGQNAQRAEFQNAAAGQMFGQRLAANGQNFNQGLAAGQFGNQARQQQLQEDLTTRQLPLNEINALRTGAQVNVPQFQQYSGQQVQAAPVFQGAQAQDQANMSRYNAQAAQGGNMMNGLFGLGSAYLMSDRRVKEGIKRIGTTDGGMPVYTFRYKGDLATHMGVMAQDIEKIRPDAVIDHPSGVKMVDYSKVA
ncbi:tail fiber domain-containing protein [Massilia endophytica]|uniref:tail fiber domain-containing protein n=1 Tax=Massilia endophytica TaxID=2899220 RepID=UPI001E3135A2|nr:tail fiber domain-containing protein [Massilia endophytica]UGQ44974.1 tail fiber domain-containing protein [Massilia endophytica]